MTNNGPNGEWMINMMNADELRAYIKAENDLRQAELSITDLLSERCNLLAQLLNNEQARAEMITKRDNAFNILIQLDGDLSNKYTEVYMKSQAEVNTTPVIEKVEDPEAIEEE